MTEIKAEEIDRALKCGDNSSIMRILDQNRSDTGRLIASSINASPEILTRLALHPSEMVRILVARNIKTPTDVLKAMTLDTNVVIRDSARFSLGRLGRPKQELEGPQSKEKQVEEVVQEIKKQRKNRKHKKGKKNG